MTAPPAPPEVQHIPIRTYDWAGGRAPHLRLDCSCRRDCALITYSRTVAVVVVLMGVLVRRAGLQ